MVYFTLKELCRSSEADEIGIENIPNENEGKNILDLIEKLLDPIREGWGSPIIVNSGFRCEKLNKIVGGVHNSEHRTGNAADIRAKSIEDNYKLWNLILKMSRNDEILFRQLIWEEGDSNNPRWIHISYNEKDNKRQIIYNY